MATASPHIPKGLGPNGWPVREGVQSSDDVHEYIMSSEILDRHGDIISADGWNLKAFSTNPIALFNHKSEPGIGTWSDVSVRHVKGVGKQLRGRLNLAAPGTSPRLDEIRGLIEQRVYRAVSVGFRPLTDPELLDEREPWGGVRYIGQELLECSIVSIPANEEAIEIAKSLGIPERELGYYFGPAEPRGMSPWRVQLELMKVRAAPGRHYEKRSC